MGRDAGFGEGDVVPLRFERGLREPKTLVLPLHHGTNTMLSLNSSAKLLKTFHSANFFSSKLNFTLKTTVAELGERV